MTGPNIANSETTAHPQTTLRSTYKKIDLANNGQFTRTVFVYVALVRMLGHFGSGDIVQKQYTK